MAYIVNKFSGAQLIVLEDGTIDTSTSLGLVGRNYVGYGETQNENFVFLLENFANESPPSRPLQGQIWFNTTTNLTYAYDGATWSPIGAAVLSATAPTESNAGALWLDTTANQLKIYTGSAWTLIGPEVVAGFGSTRARATSLDDSVGNPRPVVILETDGIAFAICTAQAFTINSSNSVVGFENNLIAGINLSSTAKVKGDITGNAGSADRLSTARTINGVPFDGQQNVTIKSSTTNKLVKGTYIQGSDFDGSTEITWSVDATSSNTIGKIVARNSEGGFSAGTISANLIGNVIGNVTAESGTSTFNVVQANTFIGATLTGNANSATQLATPRQINGVNFNGTSDITVTVAADTLTGNTLNSTIIQSSLQQLGTLVNLNVTDSGVNIGSSGQLKMFVDASRPTIRSSTGILNFDMGVSGPDISFVDSATALSLGGPNAPAVLGDNTTNLGITGYKFNNIYANNFLGNATSSTLATTATNIAGGGAGAIPFQTAAGTTSMLGLGTAGYVLTAQAGGLSWLPVSRSPLTKGSYLTLALSGSPFTPFASYNGLDDLTISVDATSANTVNKVVARDASGNFSAGTITASLTGNVTGNATSATQLQTARTINGVAFDGTQNITIVASDSTKVALAGSTMSGYLTLVGAPIDTNHAATKTYVDSRLPQYTIISNVSFSIAGFTNQVGAFNDSANFFDVFPPAGKSMANIVAFIPSIHFIAFAGGVDGNDRLRCSYTYFGDRIRVYVQNTEQNFTPAANYLVIWS